MRLKLTLQGNEPHLDVPVNYNYLLQSAIYRSLTPEFVSFLHDQGYIVDKRKFGLFVFSRLMGKSEYLREQKILRFTFPVELCLASPVSRFVQEISGVLTNGGIFIGRQHLEVERLEITEQLIERDSLQVRTLSPVVAYSTMFRPDGRKYTAYFHPRENDFRRIVVENLRRKGRLLFGEEMDFAPVTIDPIGSYKKNIVVYKGTVIQAYSGQFLLKGDPRLIQVALDAGLGSKNSMGFGMLEISDNLLSEEFAKKDEDRSLGRREIF